MAPSIRKVTFFNPPLSLVSCYLDQTRNYSFKEVNSTSFDRFGYKNRDKQRNVRIIQKNLIHVIGLP